MSNEVGDLVVVEAGETAEVASEVHRALGILTTEAAEAEQLVDRALELERVCCRSGSLAVRRRNQSLPIFTWVTSSASIQSSQNSSTGSSSAVPKFFIVVKTSIARPSAPG